MRDLNKIKFSESYTYPTISNLPTNQYIVSPENLYNGPKLLIIGRGRHGKDTLAEIFQEEFGYKFSSSSRIACEKVIWDKLRDKYNYSSLEECFQDRHNHRKEWYDLIVEYTKNDKARLAKDILKVSSCYVGMRDRAEFEACKEQGLFDLVIWVDASWRVEYRENSDSMKLNKYFGDIVIYNDGSLEEFKEKAIALGKILNL